MVTTKKRRTNKNNIMKKIILLALTAIYKKVVGRTLLNGNTYYWGRGGCCILALTALMMVGCEKTPQEKIDDTYSSITVDSCEYIICKGRLRGHKGNCRFCEERDSIEWEQRKKEVEELVIKIMENYYGNNKGNGN